MEPQVTGHPCLACHPIVPVLMCLETVFIGIRWSPGALSSGSSRQAVSPSRKVNQIRGKMGLVFTPFVSASVDPLGEAELLGITK